MKKVILNIALVALIVAPLALSVQTSVKSQALIPEIDTNATLKLALGWNPDVLNPVASTTAYDWDILGLLFDSLLTANPLDIFNLEADINWVAESIEMKTWGDGYIMWEIKLREGIRFFDGTELTAEDLNFTYWLISWLGYSNDPWWDVWTVVVGSEIVDTYTVRVYTNSKGIVAARYALGVIIFPKHIYEKEETWGISDEDTYDIFPNWNVTPDDIMEYQAKSPDDPILTGYGPFMLKSWSPADQPPSKATTFLLERNPDYFMRAVDEDGNIIVDWKSWDEMTPETVDLHGPYVRYIEYTVITDPESLKDAVIRGDISLAAELEFGEYVEEFIDAGLTIDTADRLGFGHTFINTRSPTPAAGDIALLSRAEFRRAIAYAYDKQAVCDEVWGGWATPLDVPVPKTMGEWSIEYTGEAPGSYYTHDKDKALEELKKLGIEDYDGDNWLEWDPNNPDSEITLRIEGTDDPTVREIVGVLGRGLEAIGIHVDTLFVDFNTLIDHLLSGAFEIMFFGFGLGRLPTFLEAFASWGWASYFGGWSNTTYDEYIYNAFYVEKNWATIKEYVKKAEIIYWYELPLIPIYQNIIVGAYYKWDIWKRRGYEGIISVPGAPVVNWFTVMRVVTYKAPVIPGGIYSVAGIAIAVVAVVVVVLLLRKRKVE